MSFLGFFESRQGSGNDESSSEVTPFHVRCPPLIPRGKLSPLAAAGRRWLESHPENTDSPIAEDNSGNRRLYGNIRILSAALDEIEVILLIFALRNES